MKCSSAPKHLKVSQPTSDSYAAAFSQTPLVGVCPASSDPDWHLKVENPNTGHAVGDVNYKRLPL